MSLSFICQVLTHRMLGIFSCFCRVLTFLKINFFKKITTGTLSMCQTAWIQIGPDVLSGLIWVQTVWKGYQQRSADDILHMSSFLDFALEVWKTCRHFRALVLTPDIIEKPRLTGSRGVRKIIATTDADL